tara:strand:+ start:75 stop:554 length:480 start_codon:yes stop_codon:yes gene_type:complete
MKNQKNSQLMRILIPWFSVTCIVLANTAFASDNFKNLVVNEKKFVSENKLLLIPMPIGDFKAAEGKVNFNRNPFDESANTEILNFNNLYTSLQFKGLVKANNILFAVIETNKNQNLYKVGDKLNDDFLIESISLDDIYVDISNGQKKYRLTLTNFKTAL